MVAIQSIQRKSDELEISTTTALDKLRSSVELSAKESSLARLSSELTSLMEAGRRFDKQLEVLRSLRFREIKRREDAIDKAHFKTLKWVHSKTRTTFMTWLASGTGIYWINGEVSETEIISRRLY